jgi:hypothetical protein
MGLPVRGTRAAAETEAMSVKKMATNFMLAGCCWAGKCETWYRIYDSERGAVHQVEAPARHRPSVARGSVCRLDASICDCNEHMRRWSWFWFGTPVDQRLSPEQTVDLSSAGGCLHHQPHKPCYLWQNRKRGGTGWARAYIACIVW